MPRQKKIKISQVNFVRPIYIRFGSVSRPENRVVKEQVDKLEFVGKEFILIDHKGFVTWVPMVNVASIQLEAQEDDQRERKKAE